jgi:selenocysteine-specific elongation factor
LEIIVGTAGHIDHGKTALVKALTGVDADRLPEEKRRGITIDLGFAALDLGDLHIGFVDVPGHEKFVKNMLAGAHGIDLVALVIAANEGVMPQTREHFDICRLLEIKAGLIVLTKVDLVDDELIELVKLETVELVKGTFLENAPIVCASAKTGVGIDELKETLRRIALDIPARQNESVTCLPIDRVFTVKGFGTVVTGTLVSGRVAVGDELELLPLQKKVRVRNLQVHEKTVEKVFAGQRIAVNLGGFEIAEIERGMVLAPMGTLLPTQNIDVQVEVLPSAKRPLKSRQRVRVHLGTAEVLARLQVLNDDGEIAPREKGFAQLRLESLVAVIPGERFVIRSYSPQITIAGGKILNVSAVRHRRKDLSEINGQLAEISKAIKTSDNILLLKTFINNAREHGADRKTLQSLTGWRENVLQKTLAEAIATEFVVDAGGIFISQNYFETLGAKTLDALNTFHQSDPLLPGMSKETLREKLFAHLPEDIFRHIISGLENKRVITTEKDIVRSGSHDRGLSSNDENLRSKLLEIYKSAVLEVPSLENLLNEIAAEASVSAEHIRKIVQILLNSGHLIGVTKELLFHRDAVENVIEKVRSHSAAGGGRTIDIVVFKELTGATRKYSIPLLEYFDRQGITRRVGDKRVVL